MQKVLNPYSWDPFTWDEYTYFCSHGPTRGDRAILDVFVNGGKSTPSSSTHQESGWLAFDGNHYSFTEKMIAMLGENYPMQIIEEHGSLLHNVKIRLTKREHFAGLAMQGYCAGEWNNGMNQLAIAEWAVTMADALLIELGKTK